MSAIAQPAAATYLKVICTTGVDAKKRPTTGGQFVFAETFDVELNAVKVSLLSQNTGARPIGVTFAAPPKVDLPELRQYFSICTTGIATVRLTLTLANSVSVGSYLYCNPITGVLTSSSPSSSEKVILPPVAMVLESRPLEGLARALLLAHAGVQLVV